MIHPYMDGNGRATRLLMDFFLLQAGFPTLVVPYERRNEYYRVLKDVTFGSERGFVMFITSLMEDVLSVCVVECDDQCKNKFQPLQEHFERASKFT